jgi:hypothetical protein
MSTDMSLGDGVGRGALIGAAVGFVVVGSLVAAIGRVAGLELLDSLGVAALAAVWGGPGFGSMFGAIATITRNERAAAAVIESAPGAEGSR